MNRLTFLVIALVLVAAVTLYFRGGVEQEDPILAGPLTPQDHDVLGMHASCLACHGDIVPTHAERFGEGRFDNCLSCHRQI